MEKDTALSMIDGRIRGLRGEITRYEDYLANEQMIKDTGKRFARGAVIYPIDYAAIEREIKRMEAARKFVEKRAN